ncbi:unnamed protein product [Rangifer tarandus platyrhynchus]|uniref:Uncharacterized protein n=1 Tax=Rangifer tarandus platyrhynchus TaxID=3082113 RepID=A0AC60A6P6_RANTA
MTQISFSLVPTISDLTFEQSACNTDQEKRIIIQEKQWATKAKPTVNFPQRKLESPTCKKKKKSYSSTSVGQNATGSEVQSKQPLLSDTTALLKVVCGVQV